MVAIPEPAPSSPVSVTVGDAYQPFCGAGVIAADEVGSFRSTLTVIVFGVSTLPPLSVDQYETMCAAVRVEIVNGAE